MIVNLSDIKLSPDLNSVQRLKISDEEYFSDSYKDYISNSRLKLINPDQGGCPSLYKKGFPNTTTQSLALGSAVHELFLQPDVFKLGDECNKPSAKLGQVIDKIISYRRAGWNIHNSIITSCEEVDYYKNNLNNKRIKSIIESGLEYYNKCKGILDKSIILLSNKDRNTCIECLNKLQNNPSIMNLIQPHDIFGDPIESYNEDALFINIIGTYNNKECLLKLKMKADNWTIDIDNKIITLNDLKTTGHLLSQFMTDSFLRFHYPRQMGFYMWILLQYCKQAYGYNSKEWTSKANIIAVETTSNNQAGIFNINSEILNSGRKEFCRLLKMVAYCEINGYSDDVTFI